MVFIAKTSRNIGTTATRIGGYSAPLTKAIAIGLVVANTTSATVIVSVSVFDGANHTYLVKNMDIIPGQAQVVLGEPAKLVLEAGHSIYVVSNTASSVDAHLSLLESP